ncbi:MAG: hypothetical protein AAF970_10495 [Bacteroidota bacterium]
MSILRVWKRGLAASFVLLVFPLACAPSPDGPTVVTDDIAHFWEAYDQALATADSIEQIQIIDRLFIRRGTPGLEAMLRRRNLTAADYVAVIRAYPQFWASIRPKMQRAEGYAPEIAEALDQMRAHYPALRTPRIYFTVGALRTNGMTLDDVVFFGSELALADSSVVTAELEDTFTHLPGFFATNPGATVDFLAVHEAVHTQQGPFGEDLLTMALQEGVAEFVAVLATGTPSPSPAIAFGEANEDRVRDAFARDMFGTITNAWMWSSAPNEFGVRDLGYYVGYAMAKRYYEQAADTTQALAALIELDYQDPDAVDALVDATGYFDRPAGAMRAEAPRVLGVQGLENGGRLAPGLRTLVIEFSQPMDPRFRNFEYGPLGADHVLPIQQVIGLSDDARRLTIEVNLAPDQRHQMLIASGFRSPDGVRLVPHLIDVTTRAAE